MSDVNRAIEPVTGAGSELAPGATSPMARFASSRSMAELREALAALPPPVIVFNKSHSGSRVVSELLALAGVFMGAEQNESGDATSLLPFVRKCVEDYYPDYAPIRTDAAADAAVARVAGDALSRHLAGYTSGPWGWKLCETVYAVPVLAQLFPTARFVHIIRDGRDVAFSNHAVPKAPFWQKVYADAVGLGYWNGLFFGRFSNTFYRFMAHRYNVQHWINSVTVGRRYGAMLGDRYLELRYETLCSDFAAQAHRLCAFAGAPDIERAVAELSPRIGSVRIGRYQREAAWRRREVEARARPLLIELGYLKGRD